MKIIYQTKLHSRLNARLTAYTAVTGAALAATAATLPAAKADIVYVDPTDIVVPATTAGIYLNVVTGVSSATPANVPGYDFNPYANGGALNFFTPTNGGIVSSTPSGPALVLAAGTVIGSGSIFDISTSDGTAFRVTGTEFVGVRFTNETTSTINYGWVELTTTAATGFPAAITRYAYENAGGSIAAGAVPEPTTTATLGLGALTLGAAGVRRWRRAKRTVVV